MKHLTFTRVLMAGLGFGAVILSGCSTPQDRISQHPEIYQSLSPRDQQLVSQGQIRSGMSQSAVWLAWDNPDQKVQGEMRGHATETWVYTQTTSAPGYDWGPGWGPAWGYGPYGYGGFGFGGVAFHHHGAGRFAFYGSPFYDPFYYSWFPPSITYPVKTVTFERGRVVSFQALVGPYRY